MKTILTALAVLLFTTTNVLAETKIRIASSFPAISTFNEQAQFIAKRVHTLTDGKVQMEVKPSGSLVPAFQVLDATASGAVEAAWTQSYYWVGKDKTLGLFNSPLGGPYGMDGVDFLGWMFHGGGLELYREFYQKVLKLDVVPFPSMPTQNQPLGWFHRPIKNDSHLFLAADFENQGGFGRVSAQGSDSHYPRALEIPGAPVREVEMAAGEMLFFSAAHLHQTSVNLTDRPRFSLDFRFFRRGHLENGVGAPDPDNHSRGLSLSSFRPAEVLHRAEV